MPQLAIKGGMPVRGADRPMPAHRLYGEEEKRAANAVLDSGGLSRFIGAWCPQFLGGPEIQAFEEEWAKRMGAQFGISMNSASSGLIAALGALGIGPGDEVIVTPYSMCVSATAPLWYGAVPVFADIEPDYFCLDPQSVEAVITEHTKAIIAVDILGQSHDADVMNAIAKKYGIAVIADAAQAPGAIYKGKSAGTLSDIGVYSLNIHKHIHTGEGTVVVTNDAALADRLRMIRNHAEAAIEGSDVTDLTNMVGQNYRLTELQAAIGREQLKKLDRLLAERQKNCAYINERCNDMPGVVPAPTRPDCTHVYYQHPFLFDEAVVGIPRKTYVEAVAAELPPTEHQEDEGTLIYNGPGTPLYRLPLFQKRIAIGRDGFPFTFLREKGTTRYEAGMCPVSEDIWSKRLFTHDMMRPGMTTQDLDDVIEALHKVYEHRSELMQDRT